jgi:predicted DNA-binding transcriptional regulator AlpA
MDDQDRLLTIAEAAALVRVPIATSRYWRHLGCGPHSFRVGRRVMYRHSDVLTWIEKQAAATVSR